MSNHLFFMAKRVLHNMGTAALTLCYVLFSPICWGQVLAETNINNAQTNEELLNQYINMKGSGIISFDTSNIKQFWVDPSVVGKNDSFEISLRKNKDFLFESTPLRIQLANVNIDLDCRIDIIANTKDFSFCVLKDSNLLSESTFEDYFISYSVMSASFHLANTQDFSFDLVFQSKNEQTISIKKMILSFSKSKRNALLLTKNAFSIAHAQSTGSEESFCVTGTNSFILGKEKIPVADNVISSIVTIDNKGTHPTTVYLGYAIYNKDEKRLDGKNYPFKQTNKPLNVISSKEGSNIIVVDAYTDWTKNCFLALDAKEDKSDIPNESFVNGKILEIKKRDDGYAEIIMDHPLKQDLKPGTKVRVHGPSGAYIYPKIKVIEPGEKETFFSAIKKDNSFDDYSSKAFSRGVYYAIPVILSYSVNSKEENTILISDFIISF